VARTTTDEDFKSTNVRFGLRQSEGAIGRLPPDLSRWLAPLLDHGLADAVCYLPFRPAVLQIAATLDIDVVVSLREGVAQLLQGNLRRGRTTGSTYTCPRQGTRTGRPSKCAFTARMVALQCSRGLKSLQLLPPHQQKP